MKKSLFRIIALVFAFGTLLALPCVYAYSLVMDAPPKGFDLSALANSADIIVAGKLVEISLAPEETFNHQLWGSRLYRIDPSFEVKSDGSSLDNVVVLIKSYQDVITTAVCRQNWLEEYLDDSEYLFFLKKRDSPGLPSRLDAAVCYGVRGLRKGRYGAIPLEPDALFIDAQEERIQKLEKLGYDKQRLKDKGIDVDKLPRLDKSLVQQTAKQLKDVYDIDVFTEKTTFLTALKLLVENKDADKSIPREVHEMIERIKTKAGLNPERTSSSWPRDPERLVTLYKCYFNQGQLSELMDLYWKDGTPEKSIERTRERMREDMKNKRVVSATVHDFPGKKPDWWPPGSPYHFLYVHQVESLDFVSSVMVVEYETMDGQEAEMKLPLMIGKNGKKHYFFFSRPKYEGPMFIIQE